MGRRKIKKIEFRYYVLFFIIVVLILLSIFSYTLKQDRKLNSFEKIVKDVIVSTQSVIYAPFKYVISVIEDFNDLRKVKKENMELKNNLNKLELILIENMELKRELDTLKNELKIEYVLSDYDTVNATVTSRNIGFWYNTITINKGIKSGIKEDMAVISSKGLIGRVIRVSYLTSTVKLITTSDTNSKISVTVTNGDYKLNGLIYKYDDNDNFLYVEGISNSEIVQIGDKVYTSGLGGVFPSGILIGQVGSISTDVYDLAKIIKVIPSANFNDLNFVSVLIRNDNK